MLRTSSQEGGLQQRTEFPKATSGAPNGFVRPVAVASIFRPALGDTGEVSGVDGKPAVPEKRRSSAAKDCKVFGSSLSSSEFSRRRQSFDTKDAVSLSANTLKQASENRSSPDRTLPDLESVSESVEKVSIPNGESDEHFDVGRSLSKIQSVKNSKGGDRLVETNTAVKSSDTFGKTTSNITERKGKSIENASVVKSGKASKVSLPPSGSDLKVSFNNDSNASVIQNDLLGDFNTPAVVKRPRSRNAGAVECDQTPSTPPQSERRRRNKISLNTCNDTESVSSTSTALDSAASISKVRVQSEETISKTQSVTVTECVQQHSERRRRVRASQDTSTEQKRDLSQSRIVEKEFSAKNESESSSNKISEETPASETKCESPIDAKIGNASAKISSEKRDSIETLDTQSVSKYRTCRRTSDVIAARIQTIFSKSDQSSNKLGSFKGKSCVTLTEKESKTENHTTEKVNTSSSEVSEQNVKEVKNLTQKEESCTGRKNSSISGQTAPVSSNESELNKQESTNTKTQQQSAKHAGTDKASRDVSSLKPKALSELGNNVVSSDISISSSNRETCSSKIIVKDNKPSSNKKSNDSISSLSVQSTVNSKTESDKKSSTGNTGLTKNEQKPIATTSLTKNEQKPTTTTSLTKNEQQPIATTGLTKNEQKPTAATGLTKSEQKPTASTGLTKSEQKPTATTGLTKSEQKPTATTGLTKNEQKLTATTGLNKNEQKPTTTTGLTKNEQKPTTTTGLNINEQKTTTTTGLTKNEQKPAVTTGLNKNEQKPTAAAGLTKSEQKPTTTTDLNKNEQKPTTTTGLTKNEQKPAVTTGLNKNDQKPTTTTGLTKNEQKPAVTTGLTKNEQKPTAATGLTKSEQKPTTTTGLNKSEQKPATTTGLAKNEQKPTATVQSPDFRSANEGKTTASVAKKPVASLNFFITEVSVENSPNTPQKIGAGKASVLQVGTKQSSENVEQKCYQQTSDLKKTDSDNSKVKTLVLKSETVNVEVVTAKFPDKNKVDKSVSEKGNKLASENQQLKRSEVNKATAKKTASGDAKALNVTESEPANSGTVVLKSSEKDKSFQVLPTNEGNKVPSENVQQKNILVQKLNAEKNSTKTESFISCKPVNFGVQFLKPVEKDKASKAVPSKERKVLPENLSEKFTPISTVGGNSSIGKTHKTCSSEVSSEKGDKTDKAVLSKEGNKAESGNFRQDISQVEKLGVGENTGGQSITNIEFPKESGTQALKPAEKNKTEKPLLLKGGIKASSKNLEQTISLIEKKSSTKVNTSGDAKVQSVTGLESTSTQDLKPLEKGKTDHTPSQPKDDAVKISENPKQNSLQLRKLDSESNATDDTKVQNCTSSEVLNTGSETLEQSEKDTTSQSSQIKESTVLPETSNKRSSVFQKWGAKEKTSGTTKGKKPVNLIPPKLPSGFSTCKTAPEKSEMPSENVKQKLGTAVEKLGAHEPARDDSDLKNAATCKAESADSTKINDDREQRVEVKTKTLDTARNAEQRLGEEYKVFSKVQNTAKQEQKLGENAKYAEVKKLTSLMKKGTASAVPSAESATKSVPSEVVQTIKKAENAEIVVRTQSPIAKKIEKQEGLMKDTNASVEGLSKSKTFAPSGVQPSTKDTDSLPVSVKYKVKEPVASISLESSSFRSATLQGMLHGESSLPASNITALEKDSGDSGIFTSTDMPSSTRSSSSSILNFEFPSRSPSLSKYETPRPPERKRSGFLHETSTLPPPRVPLRSLIRTGSLKRPDDCRLPMERTFSVLRSASQSTVLLGQPYTPQQRISYTEMLSKLGTSGRNSSLTTTNRKFGSSQVSELWADLGEEQSNTAHTSEMLESETSERMRLEKEVQELQSRYSQMQQKSDKMEMDMMEARVYRTTEVNGDLSEDEENDATASIYKQKYERAVRDMEIMKRRLQQQHEEEIEQSLMLKKAADKRLTEALEDVEEERQVVNQWKRKAQKLGAELQDLRLMLEEQMARNGELEKKQRRFDAELSAAQEDIRKEHQFREKLTRERDQAQLEKYSLEQEIQATRLDMDMQHEKIAILNRELDELSLSSRGEEEVTQLKRAKQELERKTRDQEEELEELAGQVQMLEQAKLRLEMSLEKLRQEHRRESSVRDEEIEEIRASSSKKIKNLEAQLENEQEERHQLVKQKHELERRIIELSDQPPPHDPEVERRLRRDLKRTKALLRDAQSMLEHMRDGQANKTLIRQLKNQLEDAEFTKSVALKARQTAELELQELQSQLEEVTRTKNDVESRCLQVSREKSALHAQLEEMEEEMAEVMKKYKAAVAQMSIDQKSLAEQNQQISELEIERLALKEQLAEVSTKLDHISVQTEDSGRVHRLDSKVRDLESKLELEQTTRSRLEHQIARLKEQCDRSREECDSLRSKELQAQEGTRRLQRQLRELREDYANLQQKESEAYRKQHELEMALENTEADLQVTKNDLRLACQRIQDLQNALEDDLDSGTDVPDDSGSDTDSSLDVSVLSRQCLTPLQRSDSVSSNTSIGSDGRQFRTVSHSQDMAFFSRMMQRRTSMDFLI